MTADVARSYRPFHSVQRMLRCARSRACLARQSAQRKEKDFSSLSRTFCKPNKLRVARHTRASVSSKLFEEARSFRLRDFSSRRPRRCLRRVRAFAVAQSRYPACRNSLQHTKGCPRCGCFVMLAPTQRQISALSTAVGAFNYRPAMCSCSLCRHVFS